MLTDGRDPWQPFLESPKEELDGDVLDVTTHAHRGPTVLLRTHRSLGHHPVREHLWGSSGMRSCSGGHINPDGSMFCGSCCECLRGAAVDETTEKSAGAS